MYFTRTCYGIARVGFPLISLQIKIFFTVLCYYAYPFTNYHINSAFLLIFSETEEFRSNKAALNDLRKLTEGIGNLISEKLKEELHQKANIIPHSFQTVNMNQMVE